MCMCMCILRGGCVFTHIYAIQVRPLGRTHTIISAEHSYILHTLSTQDEYTHVHTTLQTRHTHTTRNIPSTYRANTFTYYYIMYTCVCLTQRECIFIRVSYAEGWYTYVYACPTYTVVLTQRLYARVCYTYRLVYMYVYPTWKMCTDIHTCMYIPLSR